MFTGIVEAVGEVVQLEPLGGGMTRCRVRAPEIAPQIGAGDSVAVDGACVTNTGSDRRTFSFELIPETLSRTLASEYRPGRSVNLELALPASGRFQGHFVQGHVDGVGRTLSLEEREHGAELRVRVPEKVHALSVAQGSIALNGVSLTVARLGSERQVAVGLISHTLKHTNLGKLRAGDPVNVEGDILAKYVARAGALR